LKQLSYKILAAYYRIGKEYEITEKKIQTTHFKRKVKFEAIKRKGVLGVSRIKSVTII
jgi:hypothetical protein